MSKLNLTFACWNYDRTRALADGSVGADGIDLNYLDMPVEETFFRMARHREFDVAEMSFSSYCVSLNRPERPFVALPIYPSRFFRHSCIYVNANSGISEPKDLIGKRIASPEYQMTAPVWIRGILPDHYGVPVDSVSLLLRRRGRKPAASRSSSSTCRPISNCSRSARRRRCRKCSRDGEIDALYTARMPSSSFTRGDGRGRLFENYAEVERALARDRHLPDHARDRDAP